MRALACRCLPGCGRGEGWAQGRDCIQEESCKGGPAALAGSMGSHSAASALLQELGWSIELLSYAPSDLYVQTGDINGFAAFAAWE